MNTKVGNVIDRLKELFPEEMTDIDLIITDDNEIKLSAYAMDIELVLNGPVESYYDISDILSYDVEKIIIIGNAIGINSYSMPAAEIFTDLADNNYIFFNDFYKCKKFISEHKNFPRTVFYDGAIYSFRSSLDYSVIKIEDITKVNLKTNIEFVIEGD